MREKLKIISLSVDHISFKGSIDKVMHWGLTHTPAYVCFANVHMTIEAYRDTSFLQKLNNATLVVADGKPVATACNWLYGKKQERIAGMDFLPKVLEESNRVSAKVFLYGSTDKILNALRENIQKRYHLVKVVGSISPPFRPLTNEEHQKNIDEMNASGAHIVMVALGCPKQENWMADNYKKINAVLLGIGGAFAVTAGLQKRSSKWMQQWSLEWFHRLLQEPGRLFKRYFISNTLFIWLLGKEITKRLFA